MKTRQNENTIVQFLHFRASTQTHSEYCTYLYTQKMIQFFVQRMTKESSSACLLLVDWPTLSDCLFWKVTLFSNSTLGEGVLETVRWAYWTLTATLYSCLDNCTGLQLTAAHKQRIPESYIDSKWNVTLGKLVLDVVGQSVKHFGWRILKPSLHLISNRIALHEHETDIFS